MSRCASASQTNERVALPFLGLLDTAERAARRQAGIIGRQPAAATIVFEKRQMRAPRAQALRL
jgi:hypothetical protein